MSTCSVQTPLAHPSNYWENCQLEAQYIGDNRFNQEQFYEGEFFRDSFHGQGSYEWADVGVYEGCFYSNFKDGYATLSMPNNSHFEGLFIKNSPFGPGVLTYSNGRQDAGFWVGRRLVRLSRAVDFIIPRLAPSSAAKLKLLQFRHLIPLDEINLGTDMKLYTDILRKCGYPFEHFYSPYCSLIYDPRSTFFDLLAFDKTYFKNSKNLFEEFTGSLKDWEISVRQSEIDDDEQKSDNVTEIPVPAHCQCSAGVFQMVYKDDEKTDICDRSLEGDQELGILGHLTKFGPLEKGSEEDLTVEEEGMRGEVVEESPTSKILSWNRSELCTEILKQIFRYRAFEDDLNFNIGKLMIGARTAFRRTGVKEKECLQFLKMCSVGPANVIKDLLCTFDISPELMDARGNNSLMFAAAADLHDVMDVLLDFGVDVNTFNDEHLTPLNLCLLRRLAVAFGLSNWEAAFLPKEIEGGQIDFFQPWQPQDSILSLDRIFGDGMSLEDGKLYDRSLPSVLQPTGGEAPERGNVRMPSRSEGSRDLSALSRITAFNILRNIDSHSCVPSWQRQSPGKTSFSTIEVQELVERRRQRLQSNNERSSRNSRIVPVSIKRDEFEKSVAPNTTDRYFFEFSFGKNPNGRQTENAQSTVSKSRKEKSGKEEEAEEDMEEHQMDGQTMRKIWEIDKTIEKLLRRGADPNISEVPKPSIHLGIYTKDPGVVYTLLSHGANPNSQLYSNEGLLTPLHVLVLRESAPENVEICRMLLDFGASTAMETSPEFLLSEEEETYLDPETGRTPLELLCMRPDLEVADPNGYLIQIGLLLAKRTKRRFYNGHSCLTLAMLSGNLKLLKALLESKLVDPNEILEKERGTPLHVLVSTELQLKTNYPTSLNMCDLLLEAGSDPLKKFTQPENLVGTCVDYGYREIERAKQARQEEVEEKKEKRKNGKEKAGDYLEDHKNVVDYLDKKASEKRRGKRYEEEEPGRGGKEAKRSKRGKKNRKEREGDVLEEGKKVKKYDGKGEEDKDDSEGKKSTDGYPKGEKDVSEEKKDGDDAWEGKKSTNGYSKREKDVSEEKKDRDDASRGKKSKDGVSWEEKEKDDASEGKTDKYGVLKGKKDKDDISKAKQDNDGVSKGKIDKDDISKRKKDKDGFLKVKTDKDDVRKGKTDKDDISKRKKDKDGFPKGKIDKDDVPQGKTDKDDASKGKKEKEDVLKEEKNKDDISKGKKEKDNSSKRKKKDGHNISEEKNDKDDLPKGNPPKTDDDTHKSHKPDTREKTPQDKEKNQKPDENSKEDQKQKRKKPGTDWEKEQNPVDKPQTCSQTFPEKLRRNLLHKYGNCATIDINEFLVPYVVLRDGQLYYRFKGDKMSHKEQYSLI